MHDIQTACIRLQKAYSKGLLGNQVMPEDTHPQFSSLESRLAYFTLPMSLNYQRNSYLLWESAKRTALDGATNSVFSIAAVSTMKEAELRPLLTKHRVALQPNRHVGIWSRIAHTIYNEWGSIERMLDVLDRDFSKLQNAIQIKHKEGFPYLSGPKIFHYWAYILGEYCEVALKNKELIQIAPDTHIIKCSVKLGVLTESEARNLKREDISQRWRDILAGSCLAPIDMHSPLWFWSKNNFKFKIE